MRLCVDGLPYLIRGESEDGYNVEVELYSVDSDTFAELDRLEGHPTFYRREQISIIGQSGQEYSAWVYMVGDEYDTEDYSRTFNR